MVHSLKNVVRAVGTCFSLAILVALPAHARGTGRTGRLAGLARLRGDALGIGFAARSMFSSRRHVPCRVVPRSAGPRANAKAGGLKRG